jgi:guanylate kinase
VPFAHTITAAIVPPTYETWMGRLEAHKESARQLQKRLAEARQSLAFALQDREMVFILNDTIESGVTQLCQAAADEEPPKTNAAHRIATQLLERL